MLSKNGISWQPLDLTITMQVAMNAAQQLDDPVVWDKLSKVALQQGNHQVRLSRKVNSLFLFTSRDIILRSWVQGLSLDLNPALQL